MLSKTTYLLLHDVLDSVGRNIRPPGAGLDVVEQHDDLQPLLARVQEMRKPGKVSPQQPFAPVINPFTSLHRYTPEAVSSYHRWRPTNDQAPTTHMCQFPRSFG